MMFGLRPHYERMLMAGKDDDGGGGGSSQPTQQEIYDAWQKWTQAGRPGDFWQWFNSQRSGAANAGAISDIYNALPPSLKSTGIQGDATHWVDPSTGYVYFYEPKDGEPYWRKGELAESKAWLKSVGGIGALDGNGTRLASDDPRYWDIQYRQLDQELMKMGFTDEAQRRQVLAQLIATRNNTAADTANISLKGAETLAEAMANPRDAEAELYLRNMIGGVTPFGDIANENFGEYGRTLGEKVGDIANMFGKDLEQLRTYRDAIPPTEFFGPETRQQLNLPPTAAQRLTGGGTAPIASPTAAAPAPNALQQLMAQLEKFRDPATASGVTPEGDAFRKWVTAANNGVPPTTAEDGVNMNIMEEAMVVGKSGRVYATLAEGDIPEQLIVKPLPSVKEAQKKAKEAHKSVQSMMPKPMAGGGTINATPDDFMEQLRQYLGSLGGSGGGTGATTTPLQSPRLLAGAPWQSLMEDPDAMDYALSGYSALGISPRNIAATIKKFTPNAPMNNIPRVSF